MTSTKDSRQLDVLRYIYEEVSDRGYPPTVREICEAVGLSSTSTVHGHLSRLEKNGYIQRDATKPRAIELTTQGLKAIGARLTQIPIVGTVTAGEPIDAIQDIDGYFPIPPGLQRDADDLFMLKIRGESMINAGIYDGDLVIVRQQPTASNGDIVIAMTEEDTATCKRFFKESDHIRLQPENDTMDPILLPNVTILGKVVSLYREGVF